MEFDKTRPVRTRDMTDVRTRVEGEGAVGGGGVHVPKHDDLTANISLLCSAN